MARIVNGVSEPDEPELAVRVTVPEEFAGFSISELSARRGRITGMDVQHRRSQNSVVIRAFLPASEFEDLAEVIASTTLQRGRIDREGSR